MPGRRLLLVGAVVGAILCGLGSAGSAKPAKTARIGIVTDGDTPRMRPFSELLRKEISDLLENDAAVEFVTRPGDWTASGARAAADALLGDRTIDLVVAVGPLASNDVARRKRLPKPVIAGVVIDPKLQGVPYRRGSSGTRNLAYLSWSWSPVADLTVFKDLVDFQHVAMLANKNFIDAVPRITDKVRADVAEIAPEMPIIQVGDDVQAAIDAIGPDVDAVYVGPLLQLPEDAFDTLIEALMTRKLPSFSLLGRAEVERGILAATARPADSQRLARKIALFVQRILVFGEDAGTLPVGYTRGQRLTLNMATANAIGFSPSWRVLTEADLIKRSAKRDAAPPLTLRDVISEALDKNLDLQASQTGVAAGAENIDLARANLLPQLSVALAGQLIDSDRAEASFGNSPERLLSLQGSVTQVLYSEEAWANFDVQDHLQRAREHEHDAVRLDVIHDATVAYLNVLRAKTLETINKENLTRTRSNLELAQTRHRIGAGTMADIHRFESEIATGRSEVINANAQRNLAEIELNRILRRGLEASFATVEASVDDSAFIMDPELAASLDNPRSFRVFREHMVELGLAHAPELRQLDAALAAQQRLVRAHERAYWLPDIGASFTLTQLLAKGGAGSGGAGLPIMGLSLPEADDTIWTAGIQLSLPLFEGGRRYAATEQARLQLSQLQTQRDALAQRIEQRVRATTHQIGARAAAIRLSAAAATAAHKNLEIVTRSYSRGAVSIPTLLDAQQVALVSDQVAANAVADYLIAAMDVYRAMGSYPFLVPAEAQQNFMKRFNERLERASTP